MMRSMSEKTNKKTTIIETLVLYVYSLVWIIFNCTRLSNASFWEDEGFTIWLSRMSIPDMLHATGEDVHPPLYYLFVKFFVTVMGETPLALRITSIIAYTAVIVIALTVIRKLWSAGGAILVITLLSVLHNASVFVTEARMYELALLLILCAYLSLMFIMKDGKPLHYLIYGLSVAGAAYTHYYALVTVAVMSGLLFLYALILDRKLIKGVLITEVLAVLSYSPWLIVLYRAFRNYKDDYWIQTIPTFGKCMRELYRSNLYLEVAMLIITAVAMLFVIGAYYCRQSKVKQVLEKVTDSEADRSEVFWLYIGALSVVGTALVGIVVSLIFRPLFYERYMYPAAVIAWIVLIYSTSKFKHGRVVAYVLALIIFICCIRSVMYRVQTEQEWDINGRQTIEKINEETESTTTVLYSNEVTTEKLLEYYLPGHPAFAIENMDDASWEGIGDRVIVITGPSESSLPDQLDSSGYNMTDTMEDVIIGQTKATVVIADLLND